MNLNHRPSHLPETVRNLIIARASAGLANGEHLTTIRLACRRAARECLDVGRLSSRQCSEIDSLADSAGQPSETTAYQAPASFVDLYATTGPALPHAVPIAPAQPAPIVAAPVESPHAEERHAAMMAALMTMMGLLRAILAVVVRFGQGRTAEPVDAFDSAPTRPRMVAPVVTHLPETRALGVGTGSAAMVLSRPSAVTVRPS